MLTAFSLEELARLPGATRPSVVTIGNFDGVHLGHQLIVERVRASAHRLGARSVVVTFEPHPSLVLRTGSRTPLITPLSRRLELLASLGVDLTLILPFTAELSGLTARKFSQTVLCNALHTVELHEGEGFRLGHRAEVGMEGLRSLGAELCFSVLAYPPLIRRGDPVSSSRIRKLVANGQVGAARNLLGRPFSLEGTPARGRGYGTRYAVPTINLASETPSQEACPSLVPAHGVYATTLRVGTGADAPTFKGITNAGNRPTFGEDSYAIETHLFDFTPIDLTETTPLRLVFLRRLRDERRFGSPEELKQQIGRDIQATQRFFRLCGQLTSASPSDTLL